MHRRSSLALLAEALVCLLATSFVVAPALHAQADQRGQEIRAVRVDQAPSIDGVLDEDIWRQMEPTTGFRQRWPEDGAPSSERTEVRVAYDTGDLDSPREERWTNRAGVVKLTYLKAF